MSRIKNNFASLLALLFIFICIFAGAFANFLKIDQNLILKLANSYLIAYIGFMISYTDGKKVLILFLPLIFHMGLQIILLNKAMNLDGKRVIDQIIYILANFYDLIFVIGASFLLELTFNKIFGNRFTSIIGIVSFCLYFLIVSGNFLSFAYNYRDLFLYFSFYVMSIRVRSASKIRPVLLFLCLGLILLEIYVKNSYRMVDYQFLLAMFPLTYMSLKSISNDKRSDFLQFLIFSLIYLYPTFLVLVSTLFKIQSLALVIISCLASLLVANILYRLRIKFLSYLLIGIR